MAKKKVAKRRKKAGAKSVGLSPSETAEVQDAGVRALAALVGEDGGAVLGAYRDPFGGTPALLATLPIDKVEPTPYQRDPSEPHVKRLTTVIETVGRFLDPIIAVRRDDGYWTPNGIHRLQAMRKLGAKSIVALVVPDAGGRVPDPRAQHREGAQSQGEVARGDPDGCARWPTSEPARSERDFAFEFEEPAFLTLGAAYEERPRLSGGAYQPVLRSDRRLPRRDVWRVPSKSASAAHVSSWRSTRSSARSWRSSRRKDSRARISVRS